MMAKMWVEKGGSHPPRGFGAAFSPPSHTPLTPFSHPSHTPLTPLSPPSHTPLTPISHPSHTPLTPLLPLQTEAVRKRLNSCQLDNTQLCEERARIAARLEKADEETKKGVERYTALKDDYNKVLVTPSSRSSPYFALPASSTITLSMCPNPWRRASVVYAPPTRLYSRSHSYRDNVWSWNRTKVNSATKGVTINKRFKVLKK